jgi:DNA-binding response OmpR family regulator
MPRLLIVEDEPQMVAAIEKSLSLGRAYSLTHVNDGEQAVAAAVDQKPDLILLDIRMPKGDGRLILKALKANAATASIPVIFLTGLASEGDKVLGLNLGADDYVVKPFGAMELIARIEAVLRRYQSSPVGGAEISVGPLKLDRTNREAFLNGKDLKLQPREFEVLLLLASNAGQTLSRAFLIENTSSYGLPIASRSLDTHIKNIRKKMGAAASLIETHPKLGYRLNKPGRR